MPETARTYAQLLALYPDNTTGLISPEDLRDFLKTIEQVVKGMNSTERGAVTFYGADNGTALFIETKGTGSVGLRIRPSVTNQGTNAFEVYNAPSGGIPGFRIDPFGTCWTDRAFFFAPGGGYTEDAAEMLNCAADVVCDAEWKPAGVDGKFVFNFMTSDFRRAGRLCHNAEMELQIPGTGGVVRSPNGNRYRWAVNDAGAMAITKIGDFASTGTASSTPGDITTLMTDMGGSSTHLGVWDQRAYVAASAGYVSSWGDARDGTKPLVGIQVNSPADAPYAKPDWDGSKIRMSGWQRMATAALAALRAQDVRTFWMVATVWPDNATEEPLMRIQDGSAWSGMAMLANNFKADYFDGSSIARPNSGVAGSHTVKRLIIADRTATHIGIQVPDAARVTSATAVTFSGSTGILEVGGLPGSHISGEVNACGVMGAAITSGQVTTLKNWAVATHGVTL
jgi:hypothetical protein